MLKTAIIAKTLGGLAVLGAGFGVGFYYLGSQGKGQAEQSQVGSDTPAPAAGDQSASLPSTVRRPPAEAGEYSAPGAPDIAIDETAVTSAKPIAIPVTAKPADSEASETGLPTLSSTPALAGSSDGTPISVGDNSQTLGQPSADAADGSSPATNGSSSAPNTAATPLGENAQDSSSSNANASSSQDSVSANGYGSASTGLYHVQAGAFQSEKNAKTLEGALQNKGYAAMTVHQFTGGRDSYVVQVGAYSSSVTAGQMVGNLQRDGFEASVSHGM